MKKREMSKRRKRVVGSFLCNSFSFISPTIIHRPNNNSISKDNSEAEEYKEMGDFLVGRYWCHMCSQIVNPAAMEVEEIKCPFCGNGFVEEMDNSGGEDQQQDSADRALSLWAPILLGMMGRRRRRSRRGSEADEDEEEEEEPRYRGEREGQEFDIESILQRRRRRRSSSAILQLLQDLRAGMLEHDTSRSEVEHQPHDRVILINPFNQAIILQGSNLDANQTQTLPGSLGDYQIGGAGLDVLLQHLVENDPNRYGTPPAKQDAVEAMPTVTIKENLQCSVCLDDFKIGGEAKEMPCKHKFHSDCILPWLKLHSSCPVCRYQMPSANDGANANNDSSSRLVNTSGSAQRDGGDGAENSTNGRRNWFPIPWPFHGLFSQSGGTSSSTASGSNTSYHADQN